jgi:hypothetical protein
MTARTIEPTTSITTQLPIQDIELNPKSTRQDKLTTPPSFAKASNKLQQTFVVEIT